MSQNLHFGSVFSIIYTQNILKSEYTLSVCIRISKFQNLNILYSNLQARCKQPQKYTLSVCIAHKNHNIYHPFNFPHTSLNFSSNTSLETNIFRNCSNPSTFMRLFKGNFKYPSGPYLRTK